MTWQTKRLSDIVNATSGTWGPADSQGTAVLRSTNFTNDGHILLDDIAYREIPENKVSELSLQKGDILLEKSGGSPAQPVGRVMFFDKEQGENIIFGNFISRLRPSGVNNSFLFYFLLFLYKKGYTNRLQNQTTGIRNLILKKYLDIEIPLPTLNVQQQIVEKLNAIRKLQELNDKEIEKAGELFKSWLARNFKSRSDWQETELKNVCTVTSSKRIYASEYVKQGIPFFRSKEIVELANNREIQTELFISPERFNELRVKFGSPKPGDILLTAIGTIGEIYIVKIPMKFYFKDGNVLWLKDFKGVHPSFIKLSLQIVIDRLKRASSGSAYKALTIDNLKKIIVSLPTLIEQKQIVDEFEIIESSKLTLERQKQLLNELFESTLNKAMKGELVN